MKAVLAGLAGLVICAVSTMVTAQILSNAWGEEARFPIYAGGIAGTVLGLAGLPFCVVLAYIGTRDREGPAFWKWWGIGILVRLALLAALSKGLNAYCAPQYRTPASMMMMALYLAGLFSEMGWLATVLVKTDQAATKKKA